ncbi:MAG: hypothetical protein RSB71_00735 [Bacilli bacterium]
MPKEITDLYQISDMILSELIMDVEDNLDISIDEKYEQTYLFLTTGNTKYEDEIEKFNIFNIDTELLKKIMILIINSGAYLIAKYEDSKNIKSEYNDDIIEFFETNGYSASSIITIFKKEDNLIQTYDMIEDYFEYAQRGYIFKNRCLALAINKKFLNTLLTINPFEMLEYMDYLTKEDILKSEEVIQNIYDVDEAISREIYGNSDDVLDEDNDEQLLDEDEDGNEYLEENMAQTKSLFFEKLQALYKTQLEFQNALSYILANVYENCKVMIKDPITNQKFGDLINYFEKEETTLEKALLRFCTDDDFFNRVINIFLNNNTSLYNADLAFMRFESENKGSTKTLKKLNPYYKDEKQVFDKINTNNQ